MKTSVKNQKSTDQMWVDEAGVSIPFARTTPSERLREKESYRLLKEAVAINNNLIAFKQRVNDVCKEVYEKFMAEKGNEKQGKGNFTWFNFDRSIKIEVSINERIEFDDLTIKACKDKLDEFLNLNVESKDEAVKSMIMDAFNNTRGKLDSKKVMGLLRYKSKIKAPLYHAAMDLLEEAIRRPDSKQYFRIWARDEQGGYELIDLNFSSI